MKGNLEDVSITKLREKKKKTKKKKTKCMKLNRNNQSLLSSEHWWSTISAQSVSQMLFQIISWVDILKEWPEHIVHV